MEIECRGEGGQRTDEAAIRADYNIPDLHASRLSGTSRRYVVDHDPPVLRKSQSFGQVLSDGLSTCLDLDAMHVPILAQALVYETHDSCRDGKPEPLAPARCGENKSVNPDHIAFGINQRAAAIAWVDGSIGLNVNHGTVRICLPCNGTHYAHGHRVLQSFGTAQGEH